MAILKKRLELEHSLYTILLTLGAALVLDDFGEQASTPWAQEKLYQVISYRYNAQLPTVVTTRTSLDDIDAAISSRFTDHQFSMVFNITAPDYRGDAGHAKGRRPAPREGRGLAERERDPERAEPLEERPVRAERLRQ